MLPLELHLPWNNIYVEKIECRSTQPTDNIIANASIAHSQASKR